MNAGDTLLQQFSVPGASGTHRRDFLKLVGAAGLVSLWLTLRLAGRRLRPADLRAE